MTSANFDMFCPQLPPCLTDTPLKFSMPRSLLMLLTTKSLMGRQSMGTDDHTAKVLNLDKRLSNRGNLAALSNAARSKRGRKEKKERFNLIPLLRPSAAPISVGG